MQSSEFKAALERLNMTPEAISEALGVHYTSVYRYIRGHRPIPRSIALALANIEALKAQGKAPATVAKHEASTRPTADGKLLRQIDTKLSRVEALLAHCRKAKESSNDERAEKPPAASLLDPRRRAALARDAAASRSYRQNFRSVLAALDPLSLGAQLPLAPAPPHRLRRHGGRRGERPGPGSSRDLVTARE